MKRLKLAAVGVLLLALANGCTLFSKAPTASRQHDFGLCRPSEQLYPKLRVPPSLVLEQLTAAPWLNGQEIYYRLCYEAPSELRSYAQNRWLAPPPALLEERLQQVLVAAAAAKDHVDGTMATYRLDIVLLSFEQVFRARDQAQALVRLQVRLSASTQAAPLGLRTFAVEQSSQPTVEGAVTALATASERAIGEMLRWAVGLIPP